VPEAALRSARVTVDLHRLGENFRVVQGFAQRPVMPVLKADAYGHGAVRCALRLQELGAAMFAVAYVEEGVVLRQGGATAPVLVMAPFEDSQAGALVEFGLTPVVGTPATLERVLRMARPGSAPLGVHVKIDTGMSRLGFTVADAVAASRRLDATDGVVLEGVMTHLSSADEDEAFTAHQLDQFDAFVAELAGHGVRPRFVHAANSAGLSHVRPTHTLVRPGLLLYGLGPRPLGPRLDVRPVMAVSARVAYVKDVPQGTRVSYGGRWIAPRPSRVATIPLGYADGVPRTTAMRERGGFALRGGRAPVVGSVSMDMTMVDVTDLPSVREGDEALLFGDAPTAWEVAEWAGTNAWQVLTGISERVPHQYRDGGA
jgi:alanine racemase